jgi:hypothetical protein
MSLTFHLRYRGTRFALARDETVIGRSADCPIVLSSEQASRHHAKFVVAGASLAIVDLGSTNGTRVNGELIVGRRELSSGDMITIGGDSLEVVTMHEGSGSAPASLEDEAPDTERPAGDPTAFQNTLQFLEAAVEHKGDRRTQARKASMIRGAIEQYLKRAGAIGSDEAARLARVANVFRAWCRDGSEDAWYFQMMVKLDAITTRSGRK